MPLNTYGVLLGAKAGYHRDRPDDFGRFCHGHIDVQTPGQLYNTAIDVDTERPNVRVHGGCCTFVPASGKQFSTCQMAFIRWHRTTVLAPSTTSETRGFGISFSSLSLSLAWLLGGGVCPKHGGC